MACRWISRTCATKWLVVYHDDDHDDHDDHNDDDHDDDRQSSSQ